MRRTLMCAVAVGLLGGTALAAPGESRRAPETRALPWVQLATSQEVAASVHGTTKLTVGTANRPAVRLRIGVIGFMIDRDERRRLDCVGPYYAADSAGELKSTLREVVRGAQRQGDCTLAVFAAGEGGNWVAGGLLGEKIKLSEGLYDIVVRDRDQVVEWPAVRVSGNLEAVAGRRAPENDPKD